MPKLRDLYWCSSMKRLRLAGPTDHDVAELLEKAEGSAFTFITFGGGGALLHLEVVDSGHIPRRLLPLPWLTAAEPVPAVSCQN